MKGKKVITDLKSVEEVKNRIIDDITYYNGRIINEEENSFTFKKPMWTSKANPLRSVNRGEVRIYKEPVGVTVEYDVSGNEIIDILGIFLAVIIVLRALTDDIKSGLFVMAAVLAGLPLIMLIERYRISKLFE